ncbi:hypothetical protein BKA62DRAFT_256138 [Auriculariales sp. MPI-PUGE-AT-0066]|nr:hypothetical protein BKA62DRAFT_256138 [Auriculariales sp. MPI-PUGE-AT-0066]
MYAYMSTSHRLSICLLGFVLVIFSCLFRLVTSSAAVLMSRVPRFPLACPVRLSVLLYVSRAEYRVTLSHTPLPFHLSALDLHAFCCFTGFIQSAFGVVFSCLLWCFLMCSHVVILFTSRSPCHPCLLLPLFLFALLPLVSTPVVLSSFDLRLVAHRIVSFLRFQEYAKQRVRALVARGDGHLWILLIGKQQTIMVLTRVTSSHGGTWCQRER